MSDLAVLFSSQEITKRWRAERENAAARMELAQIRERHAYLISQHEPVAALGLDRERVRLLLSYVLHGDLGRLDRDFEGLRIAEARVK